MENGAGRLAFATVRATLDVVCGKPIGEILAGQTKTHLLDKIGMGQVDIARLAHLFGQTIDELWGIESAVDRFTDAGHGY
jgi:hypothetical protein